MITPPTDRLHKFLAIAGIALVIFGIRTGVIAYDQARQKEIEFMASFRLAQEAHSDYAEHVNAAIALHNSWVKDPTDKNKKALNEYLDRTEIKGDLLYKEALKLDHSNIVDLDYSEHSGVMRNIWLIIAAICLSLGSVLSYIGFSQWLRQPKKHR